jgi:hypothetical protein
MQTKSLSENLKGREFERPRRSWEDNIRMDLREAGWRGVDWTHMVQDRDQWRSPVNMAMKLQVP